MTIQTIPTKYNNHYFRSRLEARWAVYFDSIGLIWRYEHEGFKFDDGTMYLPDFWFPQVEMWGEVKPKDLTKKETDKINNLVLSTKKPCILLIDIPWVRSYDCVWLENGRIHKDWNVFISMYHNYVREEGRFFACCEESMFDDLMTWPEEAEAVRLALSERFENKI